MGFDKRQVSARFVIEDIRGKIKRWIIWQEYLESGIVIVEERLSNHLAFVSNDGLWRVNTGKW